MQRGRVFYGPHRLVKPGISYRTPRALALMVTGSLATIVQDAIRIAYELRLRVRRQCAHGVG